MGCEGRQTFPSSRVGPAGTVSRDAALLAVPSETDATYRSGGYSRIVSSRFRCAARRSRTARAVSGVQSRNPLLAFLDLRIKDGVVGRTIDKWLKAGVLEEGVLRRPERGTPQAGVISPMLSNIFLHHVLDVWFEREAKPRLRGSCQLVRFADDFVMAFEDARSGRRMLDVPQATPTRCSRYTRRCAASSEACTPPTCAATLPVSGYIPPRHPAHQDIESSGSPADEGPRTRPAPAGRRTTPLPG